MKEKRKYRKRTHYQFINMIVGNVEYFKWLKTREEAIIIRCAAHTIGHVHNMRFKTRIREMDSGEFEITVRRVE